MKYILVVLTLVGSVSAAAAADVLPAPAPQAPPVYRPPPVSPAYNWSGFYIGAMGGYGWSTTGGVDFKGGFAGGTIGGNAQFGSLVVGGEVEGAWADIGQTVGILAWLVRQIPFRRLDRRLQGWAWPSTICSSMARAALQPQTTTSR
jgi:outer membrane immunogenic protein